MRPILAAAALAVLALSSQPAEAKRCKPKEVVTKFMTQFYINKDVRGAFETWVDPGYIQHNPMAATGRDAAISFLEPFFKNNPGMKYEIKRVVAEGDLVVVHSWGRFAENDRGMAIVDILRVKGCKVVEHWDVLQPVSEKSANTNGMF